MRVGRPGRPQGEKGGTPATEQGVSRQQWSPGAMGGTAKRSEPEEEPQRRRRNTRIGYKKAAKRVLFYKSVGLCVDTTRRMVLGVGCCVGRM